MHTSASKQEEPFKQSMKFFLKLNLCKNVFGYFDLVNIFLDNEIDQLPEWPNRHFGYKSFTGINLADPEKRRLLLKSLPQLFCSVSLISDFVFITKVHIIRYTLIQNIICYVTRISTCPGKIVWDSDLTDE